MPTGRMVFSQLMDFLPRHEFNRCVHRYHGNYRTRHFKCRDQFLSMAFAQLTGRESLRDIETCLRAMQPKLYPAGIRYPVSRSTLADANENRDWRIYADFAQVLIGHARKLYSQDNFGVQLEETAYVFDSSTIDRCLSLFPWARFRQRKAAIKLHTLMGPGARSPPEPAGALQAGRATRGSRGVHLPRPGWVPASARRRGLAGCHAVDLAAGAL